SRAAGDDRKRTTMARFHVILRFLALTGVIVGVAAAIICVGEIPTWDRETITAAAEHKRGDLVLYALYAFAGGMGLALVVFLIDLVVGVFSAAGRRSALGMSVVVQVALAAALVVGVNVFSFKHYSRCDLTREHVFTMNPETVAELKK